MSKAFLCSISVCFAIAAVPANSQPVLPPAETQVQACLDAFGSKVGDDCNAVIDQLYVACPNPDRIADMLTTECVPINDFKRPLIGCGAVDCRAANPYSGYRPYSYQRASDIYKVEGNIGSETIIIFLQGGPSTQLLEGYLEPLEREFLVAYVAQTSLLKPGLISSYDMTVRQAEPELAENIVFVDETYRDLMTRFPDRRFVLAGHSLGSLILLRYLAAHGNPFDQVLFLGGRLDMPMDFVRRFSTGINLVYPDIGPDQQSYMNNIGAYSLHPFGSYLVQGYKPTAETSLLAAAGLPRYSVELENIDLANMHVLYSARDEQIGGLNETERTFLEERGARLYETGWDENLLGHSRMIFLPEWQEFIADIVRGDSK